MLDHVEMCWRRLAGIRPGLASAMFLLCGGACDEGPSRTHPDAAFRPSLVIAEGHIAEIAGNSDPKSDARDVAAGQGPYLEPIPEFDPVVAVSWASEIDAPSAANEYALGDPIFVVVENLSQEPLDVQVSMLGDDGSANGTRHVLVGESTLAPESSELFAVDLHALHFDLAAQRRSGQINVAVKARRIKQNSYDAGMTAPLYFHPTRFDPPTVLVYGKSTLEAEFALGDYARAGMKEVDAEPGIVYDRIIYGGAGVSSPDPAQPGEDSNEGADA